MGRSPVLNNHTVIALSREGGFAFIPALADQQRFVLGDLPAPKRERLCALINRAPTELQALWRHGQLEDEPPAPHYPS
ncbi:protealysin inhibitor emfourin [Sodalis glossinidius]|nr:protealysin inhibitor emfourin [Sodalis glossinidius]